MGEARTKGSPTQGGGFWSDLLLAALPATVLFLVLPVELYLPNQGEFDYKLVVLLPYPLLFALWVLIWAAVLRLLRPSRRAVAGVALFWVGLFLLLSDIVAPVQLGLLDGTQQQPDEPWGLTIREIVLAAAILLAAWKTPRVWARQLGLGFAVLLLVFQPLRFWQSVSAASSSNQYDAKFEPHAPPAVVSSKPNLYLIAWDSHDSITFEKSLKEKELAEEFDGSIFLKENRGNFAWTDPSVASYMTGTFYKGGSIQEWIRRRFRTEIGVTEELYQAGFEVWNYVHSHYYAERRASHAATNLGMMAARDPFALIASFADLWVLRAVPNFLQDEVYFNGKGGFSHLRPALERVFTGHAQRPPTAAAEQESRPFYSVALARRLIEEEKLRPSRGQFVYAHIYLPHPPYVLNEECQYAPQAEPFEKALDFSFVTAISTDEVDGAFYRQSACANKLMAEFIRELKRLGRYEDSAIIFHSDHTRTFEKIPRNPTHAGEPVPPMELDNTARSLLMVKPPGRAGVPLEISDRPTQLVDLPATIYDMLDITPAVRPEEGQSVLSSGFPRDREIHLFLGYTQIDERRRRIWLGRDFQEGEMHHFSYTRSSGWRRHPNLPFSK